MTDILALDIAKTTGWARGKLNGEPVFGSITFGKGEATNAARYAAALRWAVDIFRAENPPDIVTIEAPIAVQAFTHTQDAKLLFGLPAPIIAVAFECGIYAIHYRDVRDVRNVFIGHRNLKTAQAKEAVQRRCRQLGWKVEDDNAADACALWAYECTKIEPRPMLDRLGKVGICA